MIDWGAVTTAVRDSQILSTLRAEPGAVLTAKRLHLCSHLAILPYCLGSVDCVIGVDEERLGLIRGCQPGAAEHVDLLMEDLLEVYVCGVTEWDEAAAAVRFEHDVCIEPHEDAVRGADEFRCAGVYRWQWFEVVLAGGPDRFAEKLRDIEKHETPRGWRFVQYIVSRVAGRGAPVNAITAGAL